MTKRCRFIAILFLLLLQNVCRADAAFDAANQLYFEGKFAEAAAAYEDFIAHQGASATLYFNLGNAYFKDGQHGRAIAAYRRALPLNPRDPNLRFNLKFVREQVAGSDQPILSAWRRMLTALTLNEWAMLCAAPIWIGCLLLALRELRPAWRRALRFYVLLSGLATVLAAICLTAAFRLSSTATAVVILPEAVVRQGPLEGSSALFKLRDGSEVNVLDEQAFTDGENRQTWLQIENRARRVGWIKRDEVIVLARPEPGGISQQ